MRDPYLLTHLVSLSAIPFLLVQVMIGLAVGDPVLPPWLELFLLALPPIALGVWLQWQRPLYPFSIWVAALPPQSLSESQLRLLTVIRQSVSGWNVTGWGAAITGIILFTIFRQLYWAAPLAEGLSALPPSLRLIGVLWAFVCFLVLNLIVQMAVTAARLQLFPDASPLSPYPVEKVAQEFLILGRRSPKLWQSISSDQPDWVDRALLQWRRWRHPEQPEKATLEERPAPQNLSTVSQSATESASELVAGDPTHQPPTPSTTSQEPLPETQSMEGVAVPVEVEVGSSESSPSDGAIAHESQDQSSQDDTSSSSDE